MNYHESMAEPDTIWHLPMPHVVVFFATFNQVFMKVINLLITTVRKKKNMSTQCYRKPTPENTCSIDCWPVRTL